LSLTFITTLIAIDQTINDLTMRVSSVGTPTYRRTKRADKIKNRRLERRTKDWTKLFEWMLGPSTRKNIINIKKYFHIKFLILYNNNNNNNNNNNVLSMIQLISNSNFFSII